MDLFTLSLRSSNISIRAPVTSLSSASAGLHFSEPAVVGLLGSGGRKHIVSAVNGCGSVLVSRHLGWG